MLHGQSKQCTGSGSACGACQWTVACMCIARRDKDGIVLQCSDDWLHIIIQEN